ncbi:pyridoxamine 5'-phosphate oxidase family protein [Halobellus sp. Atlit-31R]|nr:pyridoxamine 5'-phosphate oxidase family protein [Halobellus sp. Atlit-31R]
MPGGDYGVEMTDAECAAFLTERGHGVLSFGGDEPYALPISFGYDVDRNRCVLQFVFPRDSEKRARLDASPAVSLVCYDWTTPDDWCSVLVTGRLRRIADDSPDAIDASETFAAAADVTGLSAFGTEATELDLEWYALEIDEMSGRHPPAAD